MMENENETIQKKMLLRLQKLKHQVKIINSVELDLTEVTVKSMPSWM